MAAGHSDRELCLTTMRAVIIGANAYNGGWGQLRSAEDDASRFYSTLTALGCPPSKLDLHADKDTAISDLVRSSIQNVLKISEGKRPRKYLAEYDLALIYFSGHGALTGTGTRKHLDLILNDTTDDRRNALAVSDIQSWMDSSPVRYIILILDCCFSGAAAAPPAGFITSMLERLSPHVGQPPVSGYGRAVLAASWHDEVAYSRDGIGGEFTHYLIEGLSGDPPPAMHAGFQQVDASSLHTYASGRLSKQQHATKHDWGISPVLLSRCEDGPERCDPMIALEQRWRKGGDRFPSPVTACDITSDGQWVVLGFADGSIQLVSTNDEGDVRNLVPPSPGYPTGHPTMIVASPDFTTTNILAVTRKVANGYALSFKDLFGGYNEQPLTVSRTPIERVKFHPSAQYVAFCTQEGDLEVWTTRGVPRPHWRLDATATGYQHINDFAFCYPAGKQLAVALEGQQSISIWDIYDDHPLPQSMTERKALSHPNWAPDEQPLQVVATVTEHSGRALVGCATRHRHIYLWQLGNPTPDPPDSDVIQVDAVPVALALSANAQKLAWGTGRGDVHVIQTSRLDSGRETRSVATASVSSLAFSPHAGDCLLAAGATNGQLKVWSYETWNELIPLRDAALGRAGARFSADGGHMLATNMDAGIIELWHVRRST